MYRFALKHVSLTQHNRTHDITKELLLVSGWSPNKIRAHVSA